ncbi:hypothetical protein F443_19049, partial [Phytophthora nicotianae P1569]
ALKKSAEQYQQDLVKEKKLEILLEVLGYIRSSRTLDQYSHYRVQREVRFQRFK